MNEQTRETEYRVVFSGEITEEYNLRTTKRRFAKAFRLNAKKTDQLFTGKNHVIKSRITEQQATDFAVKLVEIGCECYVEAMPAVLRQPGKKDILDQRHAVRRRSFRRPARLGSAHPDRRKLPSRRLEDMELLKKDGDFPGNTVKEPDRPGHSTKST